MKILLVRPVTSKEKALNVIPPIGLGYLATAARKAGFSDVLILDCVREKFDFKAFAREIRRVSPDVIGFQVFSHDLYSLHESLKIVKIIKPDAVTIAGGPHPSGLPKEILKNFLNLDFAFKGEAEIGFPLLLEKLSKNKKFVSSPSSSLFKKIPGLIWRRGQTEVEVNPQIFPNNLDELGLPAWDLLKPQEYPDAPHGIFFKNLPIAPIMATRGCPFECTYCAGKTVTGRKIRTRSVDNVISEIELLYRKYGIREIHILDDNFTINKDYTKEFCKKLLLKDFKISWCCTNGVRLDTLDLETLTLMKKSGCYYISAGIESGSDRILNLMKKGLSVKIIKKQIQLIKKSGLDINGFFILGYPGETEEDIEKTIYFAKTLGLKRAAFPNFLPLPGTVIYKDLIGSGELKEEEVDWGKIFHADVPYSPSSISKKRLKYLQRRAYIEFYLRLGVLLDVFREIKTLEQVKFLWRRFITIFWD